MFLIHNFKATTHGSDYDFDFYEYKKNGMIIAETPDLDIAIILPERMHGYAKSYMIGAIKNYFLGLGINSAIRHMGVRAYSPDGKDLSPLVHHATNHVPL